MKPNVYPSTVSSNKLRESQDDINRLIAQLESTLIAISHYENLKNLAPEALSNVFWLLQDRIVDLRRAQDQLFELALTNKKTLDEHNKKESSCLTFSGVLNDIHRLIEKIPEEEPRTRMREAWRKEAVLKFKDQFNEDASNYSI